MCVSRRSAFGPQVVAIALIGLGVAGCTELRSLHKSLRVRQFAQRGDRLGPAGRFRPYREPADAASCRQLRRGVLRRRPRHGLVPAWRRRRYRHAHAAEMDVGGWQADHRGARRDPRNDLPAPWRAGRRHHGSKRHQQPGNGTSGPAPGDPALSRAGGGSRGFATADAHRLEYADRAVRRAYRFAAQHARAGFERPYRCRWRNAAQHRPPLR